jgi:predicted Fe-Mo cluster-binding NifX family protein
MNIAAITEDGQTISQHFGRASHYLVVTVEDGKIVARELREKVGHVHLQVEEHGHHHTDHGEKHGYGPAAENRHARMAETIADCPVVLCRGMGMGAYESLRARGIEPVITDVKMIDQAIAGFLAGELPNHLERLH